MFTSFIYHKEVADKNYLSREEQEQNLIQALQKGENICLYSYPKYGFTSLINKCLTKLDSYIRIELNILDCREDRDFYSKLIKELSPYFSEDYNTIQKESSLDFCLKLSEKTDKKILIIINEFQNILYWENLRDFIAKFEEILHNSNTNTHFIVTGSKCNAMKEIFEVQRYFYKLFNIIKLEEAKEERIIDYIIRGFSVGGKVIEKDLLYPICQSLRYNLWYINQFCSITDSLSKGFIYENIVKEAFERLLQIHSPSFINIISNITTYQLRLLIAISNGYQKFSTKEVIEKYQLNSSANVKRLKDALVKKEIISFDNNDVVYFIDPLFEYWFKNIFQKLSL